METSQSPDQPFAADLESQVAPALQESLQHLAALNERALAYIRARPLTCIAGAVALGYVVGKSATRYTP